MFQLFGETALGRHNHTPILMKTSLQVFQQLFNLVVNKIDIKQPFDICRQQPLSMKAMLQDLGIPVRLKLKTDASAAKGISMRKGLGKVRHIEVNQLWLQDKIRKGEIDLEKVDGKKNLADALTKPVEGTDLTTHILGTGLAFRTDRHDLAPVVAKWENEEG